VATVVTLNVQFTLVGKYNINVDLSNDLSVVYIKEMSEQKSNAFGKDQPEVAESALVVLKKLVKNIV
jgi:hypothetical protein